MQAGYGNGFNPAIVGRVFLLISFPTYMTDWTKPQGFICNALADGYTGATPLGIAKEGGVAAVEGLDYMDMLFFNIGGPKDMSDETLQVIAQEPNVCRSIHLPVQSGSNTMLKAMNRKYTREWYLDRIEAIRRIVPDCGLSTDIIAGFCGETEEDHQQTLSLMRYCSYDAAFMFKYSERPGTFASRHMKDDIDDKEKVRRLTEIIELQQKCSAANNRKCIGETYEVLIEGVSKRSREQFFGRTEQNRTAVFDRKGHNIGDFVKVRIYDSTAATLLGEIVE